MYSICGQSLRTDSALHTKHNQGRLRCLQDVVYGLLNIKAMQLVGGGAQNFQQWFDFLGLIKDKQPTRIGAPFQMDFPGEQNTPAGMAAMNESIPSCWESAFKCSCGDCPDAPTCVPVCWHINPTSYLQVTFLLPKHYTNCCCFDQFPVCQPL